MALTPRPEIAPPPEMCSVAYKEWAGICRALAAGRQTVLLRKGGIDEGPSGFRPEYPAFWLYPTRLHESQQGLREDAGSAVEAPPPAGFVDLGLLAVVESVGRIDREEDLPRFGEFHVWTDETVRARFAYRSPGLWVLGVRVYRRDPAWRIAATAEHAGCKTWVPLEAPLATRGAVPVLDEDEAARRRDRLTATSPG